MVFFLIFALKRTNNSDILTLIGMNLTVGYIFCDIFKLAVKDFAELVKGVGVDIRVLAKPVELPRAYVIFVYQLILGYAFFFEGLP